MPATTITFVTQQIVHNRLEVMNLSSDGQTMVNDMLVVPDFLDEPSDAATWQTPSVHHVQELQSE